MIIKKNLLKKFNSVIEYFEKTFFSKEKKYSLLLQIIINKTKKITCVTKKVEIITSVEIDPK